MSRKPDARIDAYVAKAAPFAQPILTHLRELVHQGCPEVTETIKWSRPMCESAGGILCHMAAFKAHCAFGFWHQGMKKIIGDDGAKSDRAMGLFGRITTRSDLPNDKTMLGYIREAAKLNASGAPARAIRQPRKELPVPI